MSWPLRCIVCEEICITLDEAPQVVNLPNLHFRDWYAICKVCYDKLESEHDDHLYGSRGA